MPNITVTVAQLSTKPVTTRFGNKTTYSMKGDNGTWYNFGFTDPKIAVGQTVTFDFNAGTYGNDVVKGSLSAGGGSAAVAPAAGPATAPARTPYPGGRSTVFPIPATDNQRSIVRQNALTNARELFCVMGAADNIDASAAEIVRIARIFEAYACGDTERERAIAEIEGKVTSDVMEAVAASVAKAPKAKAA
jgi:hypothetical protein